MLCAARGYLVLLAALGVAGYQDESRAESLVSYLHGLSENCTLDEFRNRPALMELIALGDRAAPALARAVQTSESWSVRASAAYVLAVNYLHDGRACALPGGWGRLLEDPHSTVRAVAAMAAAGDKSMEMLTRGEIRAIADRLPLDLRGSALDWLPDTYHNARLSRFIELARSGEMLDGHQPGWPDPSNPVLTPLGTATLGILQCEMQLSRRGHSIAGQILSALQGTPPESGGHVGLLFTVASGMTHHRDASHPEDGICPLENEYSQVLLSLAERHVWQTRDAYTLHSILMLLGDLGRLHPDALRLLTRVAQDHADPEAMWLADWELKNIREFAAVEEVERRRREARNLRTVSATPAPSPSPGNLPSGSRPATTAPAQPGAGRLSTVILVGALALLALVSAAALALRRKRPAAR